MAKYGKEDIYVTASDGNRVLRERLSEYEKTIANMPKSEDLSTTPKNKKEENMEESNVESNIEVSKVQDDAIVINYIMLGRIYDLLCVIGDSLGKGQDILDIMELHKSGQLMSPPPILQTMENDEK